MQRGRGPCLRVGVPWRVVCSDGSHPIAYPYMRFLLRTCIQLSRSGQLPCSLGHGCGVTGAGFIVVLLLQDWDTDDDCNPTGGEVVLPQGVHTSLTLCVPLQTSPRSQRSHASSVASNAEPCSYDPACTNLFTKVGCLSHGGVPEVWGYGALSQQGELNFLKLLFHRNFNSEDVRSDRLMVLLGQNDPASARYPPVPCDAYCPVDGPTISWAGGYVVIVGTK